MGWRGRVMPKASRPNGPKLIGIAALTFSAEAAGKDRDHKYVVGIRSALITATVNVGYRFWRSEVGVLAKQVNVFGKKERGGMSAFGAAFVGVRVSVGLWVERGLTLSRW